MHIGPYEILNELGRGGMGVVYRAHRQDLDREFALKVIGGGVGSSSAGSGATRDGRVLVERFRREAQAGGALAGLPGIVGVHDIGEADGRLYIAMDLIAGVSFDKLIVEGELTPEEIARLMATVARSTAAAHAAGVLHRDLKPANILVCTGDRPASGLSPSPEPWITDFGLARTQVADAQLTRLTQSGEIIGTPSYMAPEQALGLECDARADVYSLGACLYEACAGVPPFGGDSVYGVLTRVLREPPPPLRARAPHVPEPLERICSAALAKRPDDRYATAGEMADDLERFVRGETVLARRPVNRRARTRGALAAGVVVVLGAGAVATAWLATRTGDSQRDLAVVSTQLTVAERASQVSAAYIALVQQTRVPLGDLEAHWNGNWLDGPAGAERLAAVDAVADAVATAYPESRLPVAWKALARFLGEVDTPEGIEVRLGELASAAEAAGDDPFPRLVFARAALAQYARLVQLPGVVTSAAGAQIGELQESPRLVRLREHAAGALTRASASPLWPHISEGRAALAFTAAIASLPAKDYRATSEALAALTDDAFLGAEARRLSIITWFLAGEYEAAARAGEPLLERGWIGSGIAVGRAWSMLAEMGSLRGADPRHWFDRALAAYAVDVARTRDTPAALLPRARCYLSRAAVKQRRGEDPVPDAQAATADARAAMPLMPDPATAHSVIGTASWVIGSWRESRGEDPRDAYRDAVEHHRLAAAGDPQNSMHVLNGATATMRLARAAARSGDDPLPLLRGIEATLQALTAQPGILAAVWLNLGIARKEIARVVAGRTEDPLPIYQAAIDATTRALEVNDRYGLAAHNLGLLWVERARVYLRTGRLDEALTGFTTAIGVYDRAVAINPRDHDSVASRGVAHKAIADVLVQQGRDPEAALANAIEAYDDALALQSADPPTWFNRGNALGELARRRATRGIDVAPMRAIAAASYRTALTGRPGFWQAPYQLGLLLEEAGDRPGAASAFEQALRIRPDLEPNLGARIRALRAR